MDTKQPAAKEVRTSSLAWGIAYCLGYDRHLDDSAMSKLKQLVKASDVPAEATPGDEVAIIAEIAWRVAHARKEDLEAFKTKTEIGQSRLAQLSQWLNLPKIGLVMGGATKIKQYVFESAKLPEIRGASGLLDRINLQDIRALFATMPEWLEKLSLNDDQSEIAEATKLVSDVRENFSREFGVEPLDCEDCIIYANGGDVLAFAPVSLAEKLAAAIERRYTRETLVAGSVAVTRSFSLLELQFGLRPLEFWREDLAVAESLQGWLRDCFGDEEPSDQAFLKRKGFGELAASLALERLQRREGNHVDARPLKPFPRFETNGYARRCHSCEIRSAVVKRSFEDEPGEDWFCEACARKRIFGQRAKNEEVKRTKWYAEAKFGWKARSANTWTNEFEEWLGKSARKIGYFKQAPGNWAQAPEDLEEVGGQSGFIGVVYADGNNMGALLEDKTPAEYKEFATQVYEAVRDATFTAIADYLQPVKLREKFKLKEKWVHRFEIISIGGDDVFLIVPADKALQIAMRLAELVQDRLRQIGITQTDKKYQWRQVHRVAQGADDHLPDDQSLVSLSSGVIIAPHHTPIFFLRRLVEESLKLAKAKAKKLRDRNYFGATIDFTALKSVGMIANNIRDFRENALRGNGTHWTAKPYTVPELRALLNLAGEFKRTNFPKSQLHRLRRMIERGWLSSVANYRYFRTRLGETQAENLRKEFDERWIGTEKSGYHLDVGLWMKRDDEDGDWETIIGDLLEIYDFVSEGEKSNDR